MERMVASIIILGIVVVTYAYQLGGEYFWPIHDAGQLLFPIALIIYSRRSTLLTCCGWVWFGGVLNAFTTSMFFDVTVFGLNQKLSAALMSAAVVVCAVIYAVRRHKARKRMEEACKRGARKQYREIRTRIESIENRIDRYDSSLERFLNQLNA